MCTVYLYVFGTEENGCYKSVQSKVMEAKIMQLFSTERKYKMHRCRHVELCDGVVDTLQRTKHRRSQGVHWVHVHLPRAEKIFGHNL